MKGFNRATAAFPVVLSVIFAFLLLLSAASGAAAHAAFVESDPGPDAVLPEPPGRVSIRFSEPLEAAGSGAVVLAADGSEVAGVESRIDPADPYVLLVALPEDLGDGAYAVSWRNLSAVDGHGQRGFFAFTVGAAGGATAVPVEQAQGGWSVVAPIGRWFGVLGLALQAAAWPLWLFVARPALAPVGLVQDGERRSLWLARAGCAIGLLAAILTLLAQGDAAVPGDPLAGALALLSGSRWGWLWIARLVGIVALALALERLDWERAPAPSPVSVAALALVFALPVPFAMNSHAAAVAGGAATAVAAEYVHILGAALWVGGLAVLAFVVAPAVWPSGDAARRRTLAVALPRFSTAAVAVWVVLAASGLYAAWLHVGSLPALLTRGYGLALLAKLLLLLPILALAALNRWRFVPRIVANATGAADAGAPSARRAAGSIRWESTLVVPVLVLAAIMASSEPARDVFRSAEPAGLRLSSALAGGGPEAADLLVEPAAPGPNRFVLDVAGQPLAADSEALLRISLPALDVPQRTVPLEREAGNRFVGQDTLPAGGVWDAEIVVRQIGAFNATGAAEIPVSATPARPADPAPPAPVFGIAGAAGVLLAAVALVAGAVAAAAARRPLGLPLGVAGAAAGAALLLVARVPPVSTPILAAPEATAAAAAQAASPESAHEDHHPGTPMAGMDHAMHHPATPSPLPTLGAPQVVDGLRIVLSQGTAAHSFVIDVADAAGEPVDDATVAVSARADDASTAGSGTVNGRADATSPGRYETEPLELDGQGPWRVSVRVSPRGESSRSASWRVVAPAP